MGPLTRTRIVTALGALLIFVLGGVAGGALVHVRYVQRIRALFREEPAIARESIVLRALDARLDLDDAQHAHAQRVLEGQRDAYRAAIERSRPELQALRRALADELHDVLDEAQRRELEAMVREADRRQ